MNPQDIVETWRQERIQEGIEQGIEQGIERGIARSLVRIYEARFGTMPEELRAVIEDTHDEATLYAWLELAGTLRRGRDRRSHPRLSRELTGFCSSFVGAFQPASTSNGG